MNSVSDIHRILFNKLDLNNMKEGFNTFTVQLNMDGGTGLPIGTVSGAKDAIITSFPTIGTMAKNGHTFKGWSTIQGGTTPITTYTITGVSNEMLYAIWQKDSYTVTFEINGATSGSIAPQNVLYNDSPIFPGQGTLIKSGYTFEGWSLNVNGTGDVYETGAIYPTKQATTFYAVWAIMGPEGRPGRTGDPGPRGPTGFSSIEYTLIDNENNYLQKEIDALINSTTVNSRTNTYFAEDNMLLFYVNRMLFVVYIGIYLALLFSIYSNRQSTSMVMTIIIAAVFLLLPYAIDGISRFMYAKFINAMHLLYKGNAFFLYEPPKKTDTL